MLLYYVKQSPSNSSPLCQVFGVFCKSNWTLSKWNLIIFFCPLLLSSRAYSSVSHDAIIPCQFVADISSALSLFCVDMFLSLLIPPIAPSVQTLKPIICITPCLARLNPGCLLVLKSFEKQWIPFTYLKGLQFQVFNSFLTVVESNIDYNFFILFTFVYFAQLCFKQVWPEEEAANTIIPVANAIATVSPVLRKCIIWIII